MPSTKLRRVKREPMTAGEAVTFGRYSEQNAALVRSAMPCGCEPYRDVFTFGRWRALGFGVRRGEQAIKVPVVYGVALEDAETGERVTVSRRGAAPLFCRCQVEARGEGGTA